MAVQSADVDNFITNLKLVPAIHINNIPRLKPEDFTLPARLYVPF